MLERKGFSSVKGAWVPYWQWEAISMAEAVARMVRAGHGVDLRPVRWHGTTPGAAEQIVAPVVGDQWFDPEQLRAAAIQAHGTAGAECAACGVWRWMPLPLEKLPPLRMEQLHSGPDVVASPEWFGDGWNACREVLVRRRLAELLVRASPRDFEIQEVAG